MIKIEDLKNITNIEDVEGLELKKYVSILDKKVMADAIVEAVVEKNEDELYTVDYFVKEVQEKVAIVGLYTNVELTEDDMLNYDIASSCGLINYLEESIDDVWSFSSILSDAIEIKIEENSVNHIVARFLKNTTGLIENTLYGVDRMLDKGDPNKIAKYLSKGVEMIAAKMPDFSKVDIMDVANRKKMN